ncbi:MAG: NBR1-Ig-like domain-containing protein [Anaerolineaceae bacterium]|nr:NBR1-Ig-like domain-containing protein [Anaerolineaceae bacterium]
MCKRIKICFIAIMWFLVSGCALTARSAQSTQSVAIEDTAVAETVNVHLTRFVIETANASVVIEEATNTPQVVTITLEANTNTPPPPTDTPLPTSTPVPPTSTSTPTPSRTPIPCNWVKFIKDVTIPDGTQFKGNDTFIKTWRLMNIGSCTWTPDYALIFASGDSMGSSAVVPFNVTVRPGDVVDVSIYLTAPNEVGTYTGYWRLRSGNGVVFGLGSDAYASFWVIVEVVEPMPTINPDLPLDFYENYCAAAWSSATHSVLPCPSPEENFVNGSMHTNPMPRIELEYQDDEPALIMIPSDGSGGMISGRFPAVNIQTGDHFGALIGCLSASDDCDVMFQLNYIADGGSIQNLGSWTEVFDGSRTAINQDLSALAGKSVEFILVVLNNGSSKDDRAFWMVPRINR